MPPRSPPAIAFALVLLACTPPSGVARQPEDPPAEVDARTGDRSDARVGGNALDAARDTVAIPVDGASQDAPAVGPKDAAALDVARQTPDTSLPATDGSVVRRAIKLALGDREVDLFIAVSTGNHGDLLLLESASVNLKNLLDAGRDNPKLRVFVHAYLCPATDAGCKGLRGIRPADYPHARFLSKNPTYFSTYVLADPFCPPKERAGDFAMTDPVYTLCSRHWDLGRDPNGIRTFWFDQTRRSARHEYVYITSGDVRLNKLKEEECTMEQWKAMAALVDGASGSHRVSGIAMVAPAMRHSPPFCQSSRKENAADVIVGASRDLQKFAMQEMGVVYDACVPDWSRYFENIVNGTM